MLKCLEVDALASAEVSDVPEAFHEEHLELQQSEVDGATAHGLIGGEDDTGDTEVPWVE